MLVRASRLECLLAASFILAACADAPRPVATPPPGRNPFERALAVIDADRRVFAWTSTYEAASREWSIVSLTLGMKDGHGMEVWAYRVVGSDTAIVPYYTNEKACPELTGTVRDLKGLVARMAGSPKLNLTKSDRHGTGDAEPVQSTYQLKWRTTSAEGNLWALLVSAPSGPLADWSRATEIRLKSCWNSAKPEP